MDEVGEQRRVRSKRLRLEVTGEAEAPFVFSNHANVLFDQSGFYFIFNRVVPPLLSDPSKADQIESVPADTQIRVFMPESVFPKLLKLMQDQIAAFHEARSQRERAEEGEMS